MFSQLKSILFFLCTPCYFLQGLLTQGIQTDGSKVVGKNNLLNWAVPAVKLVYNLHEVNLRSKSCDLFQVKFSFSFSHSTELTFLLLCALPCSFYLIHAKAAVSPSLFHPHFINSCRFHFVFWQRFPNVLCLSLSMLKVAVTAPCLGHAAAAVIFVGILVRSKSKLGQQV